MWIFPAAEAHPASPLFFYTSLSSLHPRWFIVRHLHGHGSPTVRTTTWRPPCVWVVKEFYSASDCLILINVCGRLTRGRSKPDTSFRRHGTSVSTGVHCYAHISWFIVQLGHFTVFSHNVIDNNSLVRTWRVTKEQQIVSAGFKLQCHGLFSRLCSDATQAKLDEGAASGTNVTHR